MGEIRDESLGIRTNENNCARRVNDMLFPGLPPLTLDLAPAELPVKLEPPS
jgi:hypothetical protein